MKIMKYCGYMGGFPWQSSNEGSYVFEGTEIDVVGIVGDQTKVCFCY